MYQVKECFEVYQRMECLALYQVKECLDWYQVKECLALCQSLKEKRLGYLLKRRFDLTRWYLFECVQRFLALESEAACGAVAIVPIWSRLVVPTT